MASWLSLASLFIIVNICIVLSEIPDCKAELWQHANREGTKWGPFVRGEYKPPEITSNQVTSMTISGGDCCRLKLYAGANFNGKSVTKSAEGATEAEGKFYNLAGGEEEKKSTEKTVDKEASGKTLNIDCGSEPITITSATYGGNCDKPVDNQLANLKSACDGHSTCEYKVDHNKIGDPAPGCAKTYQYVFSCGSNSDGSDAAADKFNDKTSSFEVYCQNACEIFLYETGTEAECKEETGGTCRKGPFLAGDYPNKKLLEMSGLDNKVAIQSIRVRGDPSCRMRVNNRANYGKGYWNIAEKQEKNGIRLSMKAFVCNVYVYENSEFAGNSWGPFVVGKFDTKALVTYGYDPEKTLIGSVDVQGSECCVAQMFRQDGLTGGYELTNEVIEIGSYADKRERAMRHLAKPSRGHSVRSCMEACDGYTYFSLQYRGECWCENDLEHGKKYGPKACEKWGGGWCNYIYKRGIPEEYTPNSVVHIGAYKDTGRRALRYGPHQWGFTARTCMESCKEFLYFALQAGSWCSCDSDLSHATMYGPGDCGEKGAGWCNYIYERGPPKNKLMFGKHDKLHINHMRSMKVYCDGKLSGVSPALVSEADEEAEGAHIAEGAEEGEPKPKGKESGEADHASVFGLPSFLFDTSLMLINAILIFLCCCGGLLLGGIYMFFKNNRRKNEKFSYVVQKVDLDTTDVDSEVGNVIDQEIQN